MNRYPSETQLTLTSPTLDDLPSPPEGQTGWPWTEQTGPLPETQPNGEPWPKISIVTPSYNQGQFIEETIRSVLLQGYPNLDYIVVDGGSTDQTVNILEKYDPWIDHWVSEPDEGQSDAVNKGFRQASGEIFAWLNSDDYYAPGALRMMADAFSEATDTVGAIVGIGHKIDEEGDITYTPSISDLSRDAFLNWMSGGNFMQPACFFRNEAWEQHGPLRTELRYALDVDLWLRMSTEFDFAVVNEAIAYAYQHGGAKTTAEIPYVKAETSLVVAEHGGMGPVRDELMETVDDLVKSQNKLSRITHHPVYQYILGPMYRWLRTDEEGR